MARYLGRHTIGIDQRTGKKVRYSDLVEDGENRGILTTREERDAEHPQKFARRIPLDRLTIRRPSPEPTIESVTIIGNSGGSADLWEGNQTALHLSLVMGEVVVTPTAGLAPVSTVAPVISGTARQGAILSTDDGLWLNTPLSYSYQWYADDVAIPSATSSTYLVDTAYVGSIIHVVVTATNNNGSASRASDDTAVVEGGFGVSPGLIVLDGQSVHLGSTRELLVTGSDIALTGSSVDLTVGRKLFVTSKNIAVAGSSVTLTQAGFMAVLLKKAADQTLANYSGAGAVVTWDTETFDVGGWHDTGSNTSRITVPSGVSYARLSACINMSAISAGSRTYAYFTKNGSAGIPGLPYNSKQCPTQSDQYINIVSAPIAVVQGDYFEVMLLNNDISITVEDHSWFAMERLG